MTQVIESAHKAIKVIRTVEFADKDNLIKGCIFVTPGVYALELVTLTNPVNPQQSAEFYQVVGTNAVVCREGLEEKLTENTNSIQVIQPPSTNEDVKVMGELINSIVDANASMTITTMPQLAVTIQLACAYFNLNAKSLTRFDGKTPAYFDLKDAFNQLQSPKPLPLVLLLDVLDDLIRAIRELEKFCGIPFSEEGKEIERELDL